MTLRLAAIDVGTNTAKLSIVEVSDEDRLTLLERDRQVLSLGSEVVARGALGADAIERTTAVLSRFVERARGVGVDDIAAVATSACREASDRAELVQAVQEACGLKLHVISGREEADLVWLAVKHRRSMGDDDPGLFDVGGGSTEIVLDEGRTCVSVPLGAVRLTEVFDCAEVLVPQTRAVLVEHIDDVLCEALGAVTPPAHMFGTGGTVTALALLETHGWPMPPKDTRDVARVDGCQVRLSSIEAIGRRLAGMSSGERMASAGLGRSRSRIVVAGITIVERVMCRLGVDSVEVLEQGLREGLILSLVDARR